MSREPDPEKNAPADSSVDWHDRDAATALSTLSSDAQRGLAAVEAVRRLALYGPNLLQQGDRRSPWRILAAQFADFMILVLMAAAVLSGVVGDIADTLAIVAILLLNAVIGFTQEYRAEKAMAALQRIAAPSATVMRDGQRLVIAAAELVPGDLVLLEAGNMVPADLRLLETMRMRVEEAALTGESVPVDKDAGILAEADAALGDRRNMAYKGTIVTYGRGSGLVVATGMATELGQIAALLAASEESKTPLQKRLAAFGRRLAIFVLLVCTLIFVAGLLRGEPPLLMLLTAVSLAVAAIPEALPAVVTIALALGAYRMVEQQALMRRLPSVETLGSITYICSDKTGTLTENRMRVESCLVEGVLLAPEQVTGAVAGRLFTAMALCNDATSEAGGSAAGDPTEVALHVAAQRAGFSREILERDTPRRAELPFDSVRMRMTTFHAGADGVMAYTKGAPEAVLPRCIGVFNASGVESLPRAELESTAAAMAADGLRVLALACRRWDAIPDLNDAEAAEDGLMFIGLVGLMDPPRAEAAAAVATCLSAGITPVMITGDHPATARAIARRLGIADDGDAVITGRELAMMDDATLASRVLDTRVYARVDPAQKIRVVEALQARGQFVAMTGDGVNDAPALKRADIGVAMGRGGTDVAREAADMVLLDDNFATIVAAVRGGRRIYDNIRRFIKYVLTTNLAEVLLIALAPFFGMPLPLLPLHILWVNLVTDGLPGLALTAEPAERGIMQRPPHPPAENMFARGMWQHILCVGALMSALVLTLQYWGVNNGVGHWQTMVFTALTFAQLTHVMAIRSDRESLLVIGVLSNRPLVITVALTVGLQLLLIYVPALNRIFDTEPLSALELGLCLACAAVVLVAVEGEKWLARNGLIYKAVPEVSR
ncbi:MAG: cation-translocating P-type ATPase [Burkholderiales bacterium]